MSEIGSGIKDIRPQQPGYIDRDQARYAPETPAAPKTPNTQAARPINYGRFGGREGAISRIIDRLKAIGGVKEMPFDQMTDENLAKAMEGSNSLLLEPGKTFKHRDVIRWLGYDPDSAPPEVYSRVGEFINGRVNDGSIGLVRGPDEQLSSHKQPPSYTVLDQEPILKLAHPQPIQQAKPA